MTRREQMICGLLANEKCPEFKDYLVPMCEYAGCHEFQVCQNPPKPR